MLLSFSLALLLPCFFVCCIQFKQLRLLLLYGLSSLAFCFPAFAEDEAYTFESDITEFTYLQNNDIKLNQVEQHIIQDEINTHNEIAAILAEPLATNPLLDSSDISSSEPFFYGFDLIPGSSNNYTLQFNYLGSLGSRRYSLLRQPAGQSISYSSIHDPSWTYDSTFDPMLVIGLYEVVDSAYHEVFHVDQYVNRPSDGNTQHYGSSAEQAGFVFSVSDILSWFLSTFSVLTAWILSDSMAAVFAAVFLVGCCFAMLFRVLHSA